MCGPTKYYFQIWKIKHRMELEIKFYSIIYWYAKENIKWCRLKVDWQKENSSWVENCQKLIT